MTRKPLQTIADALDLPEDELRSLRAQALLDPPRGAPLHLERGDEFERVLEPGRWHSEPEAHRGGLPPACPVTALGSDGAVFYFLNTLGQVHTLKDASSGKGPIDALFQGRGAFLEWAWPRWTGEGENRKVKGFEADECRRDLFAACAYKGTFELEDRVRGRGAWRDDDGGLIYHAGDQVLIGGKWKPCGEIGRFIYPARPRIGRPSSRYEKEGPGSPGDAVLELLRTWNWDRGELDARLLLGWIITALVGGALEQRPILWIVGEEGSGKSTLQMLLRLLMNDALVGTSNTTQAGIYQRVKQDSIAVMVDEQEAKEDTRAADKILELMRISYSGDKMLRGGADHQGKEFTLRSACLASSISQPAMGAQDQSRMAVLMMRPREAVVGASDGLVDAKGLAAQGRHLLKRVFEWWPKWDALRAVFREALKAAGHEARAADTFGTLAAASHLALWDDMPSEAQLAEWGQWLRPEMLEETANRERTWRRCFTYMLQAQPEVFRTLTRKSVGEYLEGFAKNPGGLEDCYERLPHVGLTISFAKDAPMDFEHARLFVPAKHPGLHQLFTGTDWAGRLGQPGPWIGLLRQMPKHLWIPNAKCDKGLDKKASGIFVHLAAALEA